jgi:hypothetical protein
LPCEQPRKPPVSRALFVAVQLGDLKAVRRALDGPPALTPVDIDQECPRTRFTVLKLASYDGHVAIARVLLERGANVNLKSGITDCTPLWAAVTHGHVEVVKLLLERGADPRIPTKHGNIPLLEICGAPGASKEHEEEIRKLLVAAYAERGVSWEDSLTWEESVTLMLPAVPHPRVPSTGTRNHVPPAGRRPRRMRNRGGYPRTPGLYCQAQSGGAAR